MPEGCVREKWEMDSPSMGRKVAVAVVLPPVVEGQPETAAPVLYALHGMKAPYLSFTEMGPLREFLVDHPMLLVCFDGGEDSFYIDATRRAKSLYTTFFFDELMPEIARRYRTTGQVAVTGFSMGGYGAIHYLLERPAVFSSVSTMSGAFEYFDPKYEPPDWKELSTDLVGNEREPVILSSNLAKLVRSGMKLPPLLLLCGSEDFLKPANLRFVDLLSSLNREIAAGRANELAGLEGAAMKAKVAEIRERWMIDYEYREEPGAHDWAYWKGRSREIGEFHWAHFGKSTR
ncbi:alpha/beta hydrolase family protein [soil metagenome]